MSDGDLSAAVAQGKAIFFAGMKNGEHSFTDRFRDFITVAGNETGLDCLLTGHTWYLSDPKKFQFNSGPQFVHEVSLTGDDSQIKAIPRDFPDDPLWACFCTECGAGTYFTDLPDDVFEIDYWCRECSTRVSGTDIIEHAKSHFNDTGRWPIYGNAAVHAPDNNCDCETNGKHQ